MKASVPLQLGLFDSCDLSKLGSAPTGAIRSSMWLLPEAQVSVREAQATLGKCQTQASSDAKGNSRRESQSKTRAADLALMP